MATGAPGTNGVWQYGEDDSEATFSALLNKAAASTDAQIGNDRARLTTLEAKPLSGLVPISPSLVTFVGGTGSTNSIGQITVTGCTAVEVNGVFSSTYANYRFIFSGTAAAHNNPISLQFRTGTTPENSSNYYMAGQTVQVSGTAASYTNNPATSWTVGSTAIERTQIVADILGPNIANRSGFNYQSFGYTSIYASFYGSGMFFNTNQHTGIRIGSTAALSGTLQIFGYND